ncbi:MAG: hypothetical protein FRX49_02001 [Trebouxia sp. A1-2]|nr:MAG: hypothetical protein FRX49_02001 [Trebouxia sp. A1-2]
MGTVSPLPEQKILFQRSSSSRVVSSRKQNIGHNHQGRAEDGRAESPGQGRGRAEQGRTAQKDSAGTQRAVNGRAGQGILKLSRINRAGQGQGSIAQGRTEQGRPIGGARVHERKLRIHFSDSCLDSIQEQLGVVSHKSLRVLLGDIKPALHRSFHFIVAAPDDNRGVPVDAPHLELNLCVYLRDRVKLTEIRAESMKQGLRQGQQGRGSWEGEGGGGEAEGRGKGRGKKTGAVLEKLQQPKIQEEEAPPWRRLSPGIQRHSHHGLCHHQQHPPLITQVIKILRGVQAPTPYPDHVHASTCRDLRHRKGA